MITCRDLVELLIEFDSDELPSEKRDLIEQHLGCCSPCLAYVQSYRIVVQVTRRLPPARLPPRLEQRLRTILRENGKGEVADDGGAARLG